MSRSRDVDLIYGIDDVPPPAAAGILGFQHYLTMFGATVGLPFILSTPMCFADQPIVISELISTYFFTSGIVTLLQTSLGVRYVPPLR